MRDRIRTLRSLFSKSEPQPAHHISAVTPAGYHAPRMVDTLCHSPFRKTCLQKIWENSSLPADVYHRLYLTPLHGLLARAQDVPATQLGRWSQLDGFGDLTLKFTTCAVRLAKGYMFPPGAAPEDQAEQNVMWNAVIFWSALFWHLPLLASLEGELLDGKSWLPGLTVPESPYRFRFRETDNCSAFAALAAGQLIPAEATGWLAENPEALGNLAGALWNQDPAMPLIRDLMKQAAEKTESPLMERKPAEILSSYTGEISENTALSNDGDATVSPIDRLCERTTLCGATDPSSPEIFTLATGIDNHTQLRDTPVKSSEENEEESVLSEIVKSTDSDSLSYDADALLSLFDMSGDAKASETKGEVQADVCVAIAEEQQSSEPLEKKEHPANEKEPSAKENSDYSQVAIVNKCDERSDSVPVAVSGTDVAEGEQFFDWLREGLNRGDISFNGKADKIHVIAGYVFLPVPGIFFDYLKAAGSTIQRESIQASFERLNLHKRRDNRRFYFAQLYDTPDKSGRFKRVKGYLVKSRRVYRKTIPQDSQFILFP
ncbi:TPA: TraI domain-containing protein [Klebsiella pneumoniae]|nr:TraI domain-containing protein [Klebsiella pneumoniae]